jgi:hypothetical protein
MLGSHLVVGLVPLAIWIAIQVASYWIAPAPKDWMMQSGTEEQRRTPEGKAYLKKMRTLDIVAVVLIGMWFLVLSF